MNPLPAGIFFPRRIIRLDHDASYTIKCHHIKIPDGFIVLRRISGCHNDPALRDRLITERLTLQKLQHRRCKRFGHAIDLIDKKYALLLSLFYLLIYTGNDLTHRIFCHRICLLSVSLLTNKWEPDCTLSGVMSDRVRYQPNSTLTCHLFHDLRLADTRCSQKQ